MFKHKKFVLLGTALLALAACGNNTSNSDAGSQPGSGTTSQPKQRVRLQVWGPQKEGEKEVYEYLATKFQEANPQIQFIMDFGDVGEADAATMALQDVNTAADVFMFADDQLSNLVSKGVLAPLSRGYADMVKARDLESSIDSATFTVDGVDQLYAFPLSADNGYFLMYNNDFYTEEDVKDLGTMLSKADANHQVVIDMGNGYYSLSPILNVGEISYNPVDRVHTTNMNSKKVVDAMDGFADLVRPKLDKGFKADNVDNVLTHFGDKENNKVVAAITGMWNADNIQEELGERFGATKLPEFTSKDGTKVQMGSFAGSKLVGVKSTSANQAWAFEFANFITEEMAQAYRYELIGKGPSNKVVSASEDVQNNVALAALNLQSNFSIPQSKSVGGTFWDPAAAVGNFVVNGPGVDGPQTVQEQLDAFVSAVTTRP